MGPIPFPLVTFLLSSPLVFGLPWKPDGPTFLRRLPLGALNSSIISSTLSPSLPSSTTETAACSGTQLFYGTPPRVIYTTITETYTTTGDLPLILQETLVTPPSPCVTHDCGQGAPINATCHPKPVFDLPITFVSVTKKTTIYGASTSFNPPQFSDQGDHRNTHLPGNPIVTPTTDLSGFVSWIESVIDPPQPSRTVVTPNTQHKNNDPLITSPPETHGQGRTGDQTTNRVSSPVKDNLPVGPDGKTTITLAGVSITVGHDQTKKVVVALPQTTITMSGNNATPMTIVVGNPDRPISLTINPSSIICGPTVVPLVREAQTATRTQSLDATQTSESFMPGESGGDGVLTGSPSSKMTSPTSTKKSSAKPGTAPSMSLLLSFVFIMSIHAV